MHANASAVEMAQNSTLLKTNASIMAGEVINSQLPNYFLNLQYYPPHRHLSNSSFVRLINAIWAEIWGCGLQPMGLGYYQWASPSQIASLSYDATQVHMSSHQSLD
jgi:hypothetical protein